MAPELLLIEDDSQTILTMQMDVYSFGSIMLQVVLSRPGPEALSVTIEDPPVSFSPFSLVDCTLLEHFSFNDFVAIAFLDIARDLDIQI